MCEWTQAESEPERDNDDEIELRVPRSEAAKREGGGGKLVALILKRLFRCAFPMIPYGEYTAVLS